MIQCLLIGKLAASRPDDCGSHVQPLTYAGTGLLPWEAGLADERRVSLVLNGYRDQAEEQRPGPDGEGQAQDGGRMSLEEAWEDVARTEELARKREQSKRQKAADQVALWNEFMERERREIKLRQDGQLARHLGAPLPGELPDALQRLAAHDQKQAELGLVALMSGGNTVYKPLEDLVPEDMPARIAANRLRTTWLKERRDEWLGRGEAPA